MALLEPELAILDETDSGLDIDALKTVAGGVNTYRSDDNAIVLITHYRACEPPRLRSRTAAACQLLSCVR